MHSSAFADNLRSVRDETVEVVMRHFFAEHPVIKTNIKKSKPPESSMKNMEDVQCEEVLMEAFAQ